MVIIAKEYFKIAIHMISEPVKSTANQFMQIYNVSI